MKRRARAELLLAAIACAWPSVARANVDGGTRASRARLELAGPLGEVRVQTSSSVTVLDAHLAAGERRAATVFLADSNDEAPRVEHAGAGLARFDGWDRAFDAERDAWWEALPVGLRARPAARPGEVGNRERAPALALLLAAAALPLALALRRRAIWCAACSLAFSSGIVVTVAASAPAHEAVRVLEGDGAFAGWFAVDAASDELEIDGALAQRVEFEPPRAPVVVRATVADTRVTLASRAARIWRALPVDPGERSFRRARNTWGELAECWVREADGSWGARGSWSIGVPLPEPDARLPRDPPGWINPALPQGTSVLIGRLAPGSFAGDDAPPGAVWVRLVGFADH